MVLSPEENVDFGKPLPTLSAFWAFVPFRRMQPLRHTMPTETVATVERSGIYEDFITTVACKLRCWQFISVLI